MDVGVATDPLIVLGDELRERGMDEADGGLVVTREPGKRQGGARQGHWGVAGQERATITRLGDCPAPPWSLMPIVCFVCIRCCT